LLGWRKGHADGTIRTGGHGRSAGVVRDVEVAVCGDAGDVERSVAGIGQGDGLRRTGSPNSHFLKVQCGRRKRHCWLTGSAAAARELEVGDPGIPYEIAGSFEVFLRVPEGTVIGGIDGHGAVVPPAAVTDL